MADYNINAVTRRIVYTGSAGVGPYAFSFEILVNTDVDVYFNTTLLTLATDYTVTINANGTGSVTLIVGSSIASTPTLNDRITIVGARDIERTTDFVTAGELRASALNEQLDALTIFDQQLLELSDRAVRAPVTDPTSVNMELPTQTARANKILSFDTEGNVSVESAEVLAGAAIVGANFTNNVFTGTGAQTAFTLTVAPGSKNNAQVYIDGVYQLKSSFSVSGTTLTFTEAPPLNAQIEVVIGNAIDTLDADSGNINYNQGSAGAQTRTVENKLQESVSVKDFGAVGDYNTGSSSGTENSSDFNETIAAASGLIYVPSGSYKNSTTAGSTITYYGDGVVYSGSGATLNNRYHRVGNIGGTPDKNHFSIGCIPRSSGGTFSLLDDAGHTPMNATSVTQPDAYTFRVNYSRTASKINTFIVGADDALAPYGVVAGGDVGTSYANVKAAAPLNFYVEGGGTVTTTPVWDGSITASFSSNVLTITHPSVADIADAVNVTCINGTRLTVPFVSWDASSVVIKIMDDLNGYVNYNGSAWVWNTSLSNNVDSPSAFTWTAGNNLRVTHVDAGASYNVQLTSHQGGYVPVVEDIASTYFEVGFYDWTGTKVTTEDTDMKFWYRRNFDVHSKMDSATTFSVRRGHAVVPVANWSNVAGNNFWVYADMES